MKALPGRTILVAAAISALAACSSSGKPPAAVAHTAVAHTGSTSSGSTSSHVTAKSQSGDAGSVADGLGHAVKVCDLMPAAAVAKTTGEPITVAKEDDTVSYKIYSCDYTSADGTSGLDISVLALDAAAGFDGDVQAAGSGGHSVSGLADKAFSSILGLEALYGNVSIKVSNLKSDTAAATLIRTLKPKL